MKFKTVTIALALAISAAASIAQADTDAADHRVFIRSNPLWVDGKPLKEGTLNPTLEEFSILKKAEAETEAAFALVNHELFILNNLEDDNRAGGWNDGMAIYQQRVKFEHAARDFAAVQTRFQELLFVAATRYNRNVSEFVYGSSGTGLRGWPANIYIGSLCWTANFYRWEATPEGQLVAVEIN